MPLFFDSRGKSKIIGDGNVNYQVHESDDAAYPHYYGFVSHTGTWIIMKETETPNSFRYADGKTDFPTNWTNRASLSYDYINLI